MTLYSLACRISERAEAAIGSPYALLAYCGARIIMAGTMSDDTITVVQSDFANLALILMAVAGTRRALKQERQLDELARVAPEIDDAAIAESVK